MTENDYVRTHIFDKKKSSPSMCIIQKLCQCLLFNFNYGESLFNKSFKRLISFLLHFSVQAHTAMQKSLDGFAHALKSASTLMILYLVAWIHSHNTNRILKNFESWNSFCFPS